ncbi:hypothetical protein CWB96_01345 [Pseudoalteromonas citrea]|uniref:Uncharacterized protein n=1 Tax=Pseudoalteromonas citrea TaxID=43655 RepID=A0A5S3XUX5_9GAMM|nr:hypothetical protein CWB96_01345 [Pseudoalteromonas citrea]
MIYLNLQFWATTRLPYKQVMHPAKIKLKAKLRSKANYRSDSCCLPLLGAMFNNRRGIITYKIR